MPKANLSRYHRQMVLSKKGVMKKGSSLCLTHLDCTMSPGVGFSKGKIFPLYVDLMFPGDVKRCDYLGAVAAPRVIPKQITKRPATLWRKSPFVLQVQEVTRYPCRHFNSNIL